MKFPCTACGICCKIGPRHVPGWPLRDDGACAHLQSDNTCAIYETRPDVCRVDVMQRRSPLSLSDYHRLTAALCNEYQDAAGVDPKFRVQLP